MKKVLLTGARGFIGRHCLDLLAGKGYEVHAVSSKGRYNDFHGQTVEWHHADLHNAEHILRLTAGLRPELLLHLAWDVKPGTYWHTPENLRWVKSSLSLLQAFIDAGGQRVVMAGSCAEYDWNYGYFTEALTPLNPATLYGVCKSALQTVMTAAGREAKVSTAWGRLFFLYGPGEHEERLIPSVINAVIRGEQINCTHGEQVRDYLYIKDAASAIAALLDSAVTGPVNIASGQPVALKELIGTAAEIAGNPDLVRLGTLETTADEPPMLVANVKRLFDQVGWQPQYDLRTGLQETVDYWKLRNERERQD